jgi:hypothetical protein
VCLQHMSGPNAPAIANRLHRSGAIDFNVEFASRQASIYRDTKNSKGKRLFERASNDDSLSVCEAEPLYTPKRSKSNNSTSGDSVRNPIACISCVNGLPDSNGQDAIVLDSEQVTGHPEKHEEIRDRFFNQYHYAGIAVSKWAYDRAGMQQQQFVATAGGLNTIYCDVACQAGDTIVIDMPMPTDPDIAKKLDRYDPSSGDNTQGNSWGFVKCIAKKGTPSEKQTLIVRPMPPLPARNHKMIDHIKTMRHNFVSRGQIVGQCVKGAKKGERIDIVLGANAICGIINMSDRV